jgi:putative redox protein
MTIDCRTETPGQFRQILQIDAHTLHVDLLAASGGEGSAPDGHDYFDASLAACKALTAAWYAKAHKIALDRVNVHVERDGSAERQGTYVLKVKIGYEGALTDADRQKLHEAVTRCPIHKLMTTTKVDIQTAPLELQAG